MKTTKQNYVSKLKKSKGPDFGAEFKIGSFRARWCENLSAYFREHGPADKVIRLNHKGWFIDNLQDETIRGAVYRLPPGKFLAVAMDPWNEGAGMIENCVYDCEKDAARNADRIAEIYAENARQDDAKFQAEVQIENAKELIANARETVRELIAGIRQSNLAPRICAQLKNDIKRERAGIRAQFARIEKLSACYWNAVQF